MSLYFFSRLNSKIYLCLKVDLALIRKEYKNLFNRALSDDLAKELNGDLEDIVLELVGKD